VHKRPLAVLFCVLALFTGCSKYHRLKADRQANRLIAEKQKAVLGKQEKIDIQMPADTLRKRLIEQQKLTVSSDASLGTKNLKPIKHWPHDDYLDPKTGQQDTSWMPDVASSTTLKLSLTQALQVAAFGNREYQTRKEDVFVSALRLEQERHRFENSFTGVFTGLFSHDRSGLSEVNGASGSGTLGVSRRLKSGLTLASHYGIDLAQLLEPNSTFSKSVFADASVTLPVLRGGGRFVVTEPLTQAERNLVYALYNFETYKRDFAVQIASSYLSVLQNLDAIQNAEENYKGLIASTRRARRLADAGMLPEIQFDQAVQEELRARDRWIRSLESYSRSIDQFNIQLGLPTDASIVLDRSEMDRLAESTKAIMTDRYQREQTENIPPADAPITLRQPTKEGAGPFELPEEVAIPLALKNRLDLRVAQGAVYDEMRGVTLAANDLLPDLVLSGNADWGENRSIGSSGLPDQMHMNWDKGRYTANANLQLPLERTAEGIAYRQSYIALEKAVRNEQQLEDNVKLDVRNDLRTLLQSRESLQIQAQAVALADRRVRSTNLLLQAGRAEIRDLLEAQDALLSAQNSLTQAMVAYRVAELEIQRDMGVLQVNEKGLWQEFNPQEIK